MKTIGIMALLAVLLIVPAQALAYRPVIGQPSALAECKVFPCPIARGVSMTAQEITEFDGAYDDFRECVRDIPRKQKAFAKKLESAITQNDAAAARRQRTTKYLFVQREVKNFNREERAKCSFVFTR